jgi:putative endopeptidase
MICVRSAVAVVAIAACSAGPAGPTGTRVEPSTVTPANHEAVTSSPGAGIRVTLGDVGLEPGSLDRSADPCVDFYQFACGGWIQNNPIPPDRAQWSRFTEVDERNKLALKAVLEDAARGVRATPATGKLGDFYAACLDEAAIERTGTAALRPLLARLQSVADAAGWLGAVVELHKLGIWVVWRQRARPDARSSTIQVTTLDAAGLGLPDRDYYLKPERKAVLAGYQRHVAAMLGLAGAGGPADGAQAVVAIETELAKLTRTAVAQRDLAAGYHPTDLAGLAGQARSLDWPRYFQGVGQGVGAAVRPSDKLIVVAPDLFAGLDKLRAQFKPAAWASYFTYHLVVELAFALPKPFDDEAFALRRLVTGVEQKPERSKRCIDRTAAALGELLGQQYVTKYFPDSSKQTASQLVEAIVKVMADELAGLPWLAESTKQGAVAKLGKLERLIGYPARWKPYDFEVKRDDFAGNLLRAAAFATHRELARAGQPVDRSDWQASAFGVEPYYDASTNTMGLPAGVLQPPFFGQDRAVAANLGGLGMLIGHELSHGFDDQGAQLDADGNLNAWWQPDELAKLAEGGKCMADQYGTFEALPGQFVHLTDGEGIADLGGVRMAFKAYRSLRKDAARTYVADGLTEDQQFFVAVGQIWCGHERPAETERRLTTAAHAPFKLRVYGALRNMKEFADAFRCVAGTPMRPAQTCTVW